MLLNNENKIPKLPKNATKEQKAQYKKLKKEFAYELKGKKFKARAIEQEKDPYIKAIYLKLSPEDLSEYMQKEHKKQKQISKDKLGSKYVANISNKILKNSLIGDERKKFSFKILMDSNFVQYFYGVEKERRRIRWLSNKELFKDSMQSLCFVICFSVVLATLDFILSVFRYFHIF